MLGQPGLLLGNPSLGGTVIDGGPMMPSSELPPPKSPNNPPETVQSFQIGPPVEALPSTPSVPAPVAAPFAMSNPTEQFNDESVPEPLRCPVGKRRAADYLHNRPERGDSVITISRGIRLRFGDVSMATNGGVVDLGAVLIEADRAVIWDIQSDQAACRGWSH